MSTEDTAAPWAAKPLTIPMPSPRRPSETVEDVKDYYALIGQIPATYLSEDTPPPKREVQLHEDIPTWQSSQAYADLMHFILWLNASSRGVKLRDKMELSPIMERLLAMLHTLTEWLADIPAVDQPQRFGNSAYKTWNARLQKDMPQLLSDLIPSASPQLVTQLAPYLLDSFGNATRIDYGTGHELAFVAFLACLTKVSLIAKTDGPALAMKVFDQYISLSRQLQKQYNMEPAGTHGVFSLDDYQFMPFVLGSSQLIQHQRLKPKHFVEDDYVSEFSKDYMFFAAIKHINETKTGLFAEHSNQLWNISAVQLWSKVNGGLIKMYQAELLAKFPAIQHFNFGALLRFVPAVEAFKVAVAPPGPDMSFMPTVTKLPVSKN